MKLKYYLRGLGLGILVTALILGIAHMAQDKKQGMTDEEVITRAKELGMTESMVLADMVSSREENTEQSAEPESTVEASSQPESDPSTEEKAEDNTEESSEAESSEAESSEPESTPDSTLSDGQETVEIHIVSGDSSVSVSKKLAEAGLVEDVKEYDRYLCANGYDKKIRVGSYTISVNATLEEIAKIITGQK